MKIIEEYPNYNKGLVFLIGDKNPVLASNDSKILSYFLCLANFKRGFDYYELTRCENGGVIFSIVTMLGLRTVLRTDSEIYFHDINENEWTTMIYKISMLHFNKDEYIKLSQGYVKKKSSGCMAILSLLVVVSILVSIFK